MRHNEAPQPVRLADYRPSDYLIDTVELDFALDPERTRVTTRLAVRPRAFGLADRAADAERRGY